MAETAHRWRWRILLGLAGGVAVASAAVAISNSGVFGAEHLFVVGERALSGSEVLDAAGLEPGVNVFHLDPAVPEAALLEDPWVAEAVVEASLPNTITVRISERRPIAVGEGQAVAGDGTVLPGAEVGGLPRIVAEGALDPERRSSAAAVLSSLGPGARRDVTRVLVGADRSVTVSMGSLDVRWGMPVDNGAKAAALAAVLDANATALPATIDVTVPGAPAVVPG
jgi:cell division protein FtsQ